MTSIRIQPQDITVDFWRGGQAMRSRLMPAQPPEQSGDRSIVETFPGEEITLEALRDTITSVRYGGRDFEGPSFSFKPIAEGLHLLEVTFASGWLGQVRVIVLSDEWLRRARVSTLSATTRDAWMKRARSGIRQLLREHQLTDGAFPEHISLSDYGVGQGIPFSALEAA